MSYLFRTRIDFDEITTKSRCFSLPFHRSWWSIYFSVSFCWSGFRLDETRLFKSWTIHSKSIFRRSVENPNASRLGIVDRGGVGLYSLPLLGLGAQHGGTPWRLDSVYAGILKCYSWIEHQCKCRASDGLEGFGLLRLQVGLGSWSGLDTLFCTSTAALGLGRMLLVLHHCECNPTIVCLSGYARGRSI